MSLRVLAVGRTMTGKTEWLRRRYLRRLDRVLVVDTIGEWSSEPDAIHASGSEEVVEAVTCSGGSFLIVADLDRDELVEVADVIAPRRIDESPVAGMGGLAIALDEVDLLCPQADNRLAGLWRRGRHVDLSVFAATQRPASVNKEVSAMVDIYGVLPVTEVRDVQYLRQRFGRELADEGLAWCQGAPHRVAAFAGGGLYRLPPEPG